MNTFLVVINEGSRKEIVYGIEKLLLLIDEAKKNDWWIAVYQLGDCLLDWSYLAEV